MFSKAFFSLFFIWNCHSSINSRKSGFIVKEKRLLLLWHWSTNFSHFVLDLSLKHDDFYYVLLATTKKISIHRILAISKFLIYYYCYLTIFQVNIPTLKLQLPKRSTTVFLATIWRLVTIDLSFLPNLVSDLGPITILPRL